MTGRSPLGPNYWRFWTAAAASNLGDGIRLGAMPLLALELTDDARLISAVTAATILPWFVLGAFGGAIADRADRRRLILVSHLGRAGLLVVLVVASAAGTLDIRWLLLIAFGLGVGEVFADSSAQAAIPQLVEAGQLERANARLIAAITVLDQVVGVTVGAVLFAFATGLPFAVDAATFLAAAVVLSTVRRPLQGERRRTSTVRNDIVEGFQFLGGHRFLRSMAAAVGLTNLAGNVGFAVLVILAVDELGASPAGFGVVLGIGATGGVLGSLIAERIVERLGRRRVMSSLHAALVLGLVLNATAVHIAMVALAFFASSLAIVVFNVPAQSIRQTVTPEPLLGRVVASFRMVGVGAAAVGAVLGGVATEVANVRVAMLVGAAVMLLAWLTMIRALRFLPTDDRGTVAVGAER